MILIKFILRRAAPTFWGFMTGNGAQARPRLPQQKQQSRVVTWQDSLNELQLVFD
jgi:hypothetical protein